ncbi:chemotaxis protein CheB [Pleionea sediminis]|uniref:chemotaxis protein CheB n=1 Tax=Pleionea sediminis TaxID=2569479 RepID=UPI001185352E|nr:chemotaxis protein CheB [Pleionea sediminis]
MSSGESLSIGLITSGGDESQRYAELLEQRGIPFLCEVAPAEITAEHIDRSDLHIWLLDINDEDWTDQLDDLLDQSKVAVFFHERGSLTKQTHPEFWIEKQIERLYDMAGVEMPAQRQESQDTPDSQQSSESDQSDLSLDSEETDGSVDRLNEATEMLSDTLQDLADIGEAKSELADPIQQVADELSSTLDVVSEDAENETSASEDAHIDNDSSGLEDISENLSSVSDLMDADSYDLSDVADQDGNDSIVEQESTSASFSVENYSNDMDSFESELDAFLESSGREVVEKENSKEELDEPEEPVATGLTVEDSSESKSDESIVNEESPMLLDEEQHSSDQESFTDSYESEPPALNREDHTEKPEPFFEAPEGFDLDEDDSSFELSDSDELSSEEAFDLSDGLELSIEDERKSEIESDSQEQNIVEQHESLDLGGELDSTPDFENTKDNDSTEDFSLSFDSEDNFSGKVEPSFDTLDSQEEFNLELDLSSDGDSNNSQSDSESSDISFDSSEWTLETDSDSEEVNDSITPIDATESELSLSLEAEDESDDSSDEEFSLDIEDHEIDELESKSESPTLSSEDHQELELNELGESLMNEGLEFSTDTNPVVHPDEESLGDVYPTDLPEHELEWKEHPTEHENGSISGQEFLESDDAQNESLELGVPESEIELAEVEENEDIPLLDDTAADMQFVELEEEFEDVPDQQLWILGASLGGPAAVKRFLQALPAETESAFVLAQHIDESFLPVLCNILDSQTAFRSVIVEQQMKIEKGCVYIAPINSKLTFDKDGFVDVTSEKWTPPYSPCIDDVIVEAGQVYQHNCGVIIFSGMGNDGSVGVEQVANHKVRVWIQSPESCANSSMPESILEKERADYVGNPEELAEHLTEYMHNARVKSA